MATSVPHAPAAQVARGLGLVFGGSLAVVVIGAASLLATQDPATTLLALVGGIVVLGAAFRPELALLVLVAAGPLEGALQSTTTSTLSITKVAGVLAFGGFVANALMTRRRIVADMSHLVVVLILAIAMVSTLQAHDTASAMTTTVRYASFVLLYWLITQTVGDHRLQRRVAWTVVLATTIAAALALRNFVDGTTFVAELQGTQSNDMGFMLACTIPIAFWLLGSRPILRPVVVGSIGLLAAALVFSFARGGMLALACGALWYVLVERKHVRLLLAGAVVAALGAFFIAQSNTSTVSTGLKLKEHVAAENVSTRLQAWDAAAQLASEHPLLGIGPGNFRDVYYEATGRPPGSVPRLAVVHNAYLDIAAELGLIALLLFLVYLALAFTRLARSARENLGPPGLPSIIRTSLVIACVGSLTLSEQYFPEFWLFGGLAAAFWAERRLRPLAIAEAALVVPAAPPEQAYDLEVSERRVEERERRASAQFEAIRSMQSRIARRLAELDERGSKLARMEARLAAREQGISARERSIAEPRDAREETIAARERELEERRRDLETRFAAREQAIAALERELEERFRALEAAVPSPPPFERGAVVVEPEPVAAEPEPEPVAREPEPRPLPQPTPPPSAPLSVPAASAAHLGPGRDVFELESIVAALAHTDPDRADELRAYTMSLREYADVDGRLPEQFQGLVLDVFGDLLKGF